MASNIKPSGTPTTVTINTTAATGTKIRVKAPTPNESHGLFLRFATAAVLKTGKNLIKIRPTTRRVNKLSSFKKSAKPVRTPKTFSFEGTSSGAGEFLVTEPVTVAPEAIEASSVLQ